jgi:hypothetical protein
MQRELSAGSDARVAVFSRNTVDLDAVESAVRKTRFIDACAAVGFVSNVNIDLSWRRIIRSSHHCLIACCRVLYAPLNVCCCDDVCFRILCK